MLFRPAKGLCDAQRTYSESTYSTLPAVAAGYVLAKRKANRPLWALEVRACAAAPLSRTEEPLRPCPHAGVVSRGVPPLPVPRDAVICGDGSAFCGNPMPKN